MDKNEKRLYYLRSPLCKYVRSDPYRISIQKCQRFSGGEKQAVAFLRMAAKNAEVILLDEPFSAMDAKMKSAVEHYLFTGKEFEGKTVLVITHDTREESLSQYDGIIHVGENGIYVE